MMKNRRSLFLALATALMLSPPLGAAAAGGFVAGTEDLPLMTGLTPVGGSSLIFDTPQGRIVEAQAKGKVTREQVRVFYSGTLPQLGWAPAGADVWQREGETLRIDVAGRDGDLTVGFTLSPQ